MNWALKYRKSTPRWLLSSFVLLFCFSLVQAQSLDKLKKDRLKIQNDIEAANKLLLTIKSEQVSITENVTLLNNQIKGRQKILESYKSEINTIQSKIKELDLSIASLETDIVKHKTEYELLLLELYKRRNSYDAISYLLGSTSLNQGFARYRMIQELNKYRKSQILVLKKSEELLIAQKSKYTELKMVLENSLREARRENKLMLSKKNEHEIFLQSLKGKEKQLHLEIKSKRKSDEALEEKILELIANESKLAASMQGRDFAKFKGNLAWPVAKSVIVSFFGEHDHPALKGVKVKNNGIDFKVSDSKDVVSVFDGEVSRIIRIPGYNKAIILRHGKYLTVYANIDEIDVKQGQLLKSGQVIGKVFVGDGTNSNTLHFEIWNENNKLNPEQWLKM